MNFRFSGMGQQSQRHSLQERMALQRSVTLQVPQPAASMGWMHRFLTASIALRFRLVFGALVFLGYALVDTALSQGPMLVPVSEGANVVNQLPSERAYETALNNCDSSIADERWDRALDSLQQLLDAPGDYFHSDGSGKSIRELVDERFIALPLSARNQYDRKSDKLAEALLSEAAEQGDEEKLNLAVRRYFFTSHGLEAARELAGRLYDRGEMDSASRLYDRLFADPIARGRMGATLTYRTASAHLLNGNEAAARTTLLTLKGHGGTIRVDGQELTLFAAGSDPVTWLQEQIGGWQPGGSGSTPFSTPSWLSARGGGMQNTSVASTPPVWDGAWSIPLIVEQQDSTYAARVQSVNRMLKAMEDEFLADRNFNRILIPAGVPLVVDGNVIFHGPGKVKSVPLQDGNITREGEERAYGWHSSLGDETFQSLLEKDWIDSDEPLRKLFFAQRAWRDGTSAAISSDGKTVFAVSHCGMIGAMNTAQAALLPTRHPNAPQKDNMLQAYQVAGGKLKWVIGGKNDRAGDSQEGIFFLGAALPHHGKLYTLVEEGGQVLLLIIDPETGNREWSVPLVNVPFQLSIVLSDQRRTLSLSPAIVGDTIICPTGTGLVIAIDLRMQRLLWVSQHHTEVELDARAAQVLRMQQSRNRQLSLGALEDLIREPRWFDVTPIVSDGCVIVPAVETEMLLCLDLKNGAIRWTRPRGQDLYVAGVYDGRVVLVGQSQVTAYSIQNGERVWGESTPISTPSGRGYRSGRFYSLPLRTGEIATIDLKDGRIVASSPLRSSKLPGNLVAAGGRVLFQSATQLVVFRSQSEMLEEIQTRLAANPQDSAALALRGEMRLHQGELESAFADLRIASRADDNLRARRLLVSGLLDGLRSDFAMFRKYAEEAKLLVVGTPEEATFHRLYATGLQQVGDHREAFHEYLAIASMAQSSKQLEPAGADVSVRVDRWVQGKIETLLDKSQPEDRAWMEQTIQDRFQEILAIDNTGDALKRLRQFEQTIPLGPHADAARIEIVRRLDPNQRLEAEQRLLSTINSEFVSIRAESTARLAMLYLSTGGNCDDLLARLSSEFGEIPALDGETGAQLVASWKTALPVSDDPAVMPVPIVTPIDWPQTPVTATLTQLPRRSTINRIPIPVIGEVSGPMSGWQYHMDQQRSRLMAFDADGLLRWEAKFPNEGNINQKTPQYLLLRGHLMQVAFPDRFLLFDTFATVDPDKPHALPELDPLWGEILSQITPGANTIAGPSSLRGFRGLVVKERSGHTVGNAGPLTGDTFCYQVGDVITAVDPLTQEVVWTRSNQPRGCEILADHQYVILKPYENASMTILRATDGSEVKQISLPSGSMIDRRHAEWGRWLFVEDVTYDKARNPLSIRYGMVDPVTETANWTREVPAGSKWAPVDGHDIAILQPDGKFNLLDAQTGEETISLQFEPNSNLLQFHILSDGLRHYIVEEVPQKVAGNRVSAVIRYSVRTNGHVTAISRQTGKKLWSTEVIDQYVDLRQPSRWPFLIFAASTITAATRHTSNSVQILDRTTGKLVYEGLGEDTRGYALWSVDPTHYQVIFTFLTQSLTIQCGPPPSAPEVSEAPTE